MPEQLADMLEVGVQLSINVSKLREELSKRLANVTATATATDSDYLLGVAHGLTIALEGLRHV